MTDARTPELTLPQELLLLALDDEKGRGNPSVALGGGILAELVFRGAVEVVEDGKKSVVEPVAAAAPPADEILAECLADVVESKKRRDATHWVGKFSGKRDLRSRVAQPLVARGVLDERRRKLLFVTTTSFPELDPGPEIRMTERLRAAIEYDHVEPDARTAALISMANAAGLLSNNLDKKMLRSQNKRLAEISEGEHIGSAVKSAIDSTNAAIAAVIVAGTVTTN